MTFSYAYIDLNNCKTYETSKDPSFSSSRYLEVIQLIDLHFCLIHNKIIVERLNISQITYKWSIVCIRDMLDTYEKQYKTNSGISHKTNSGISHKTNSEIISDNTYRFNIYLLTTPRQYFNLIQIIKSNKTKKKLYKELLYICHDLDRIDNMILYNIYISLVQYISYKIANDFRYSIYTVFYTIEFNKINNNDTTFHKNSLIKIIKSSSKYYKGYMKVLEKVLPNDLNYIIMNYFY